MEAFPRIRSTVIPMLQPDINTDEIIPARFMSRPRVDYGRYFFHDRRFANGGAPTRFVLDDARYAGAKVLLAGANFGCGSSREHAVFALADYGIRVVMAPQIADIFHANCFKNGVLPIVLSPQAARELGDMLGAAPEMQVEVDLEQQALQAGATWSFRFDIDAFRKRNLLHGLDEIDRTLELMGEIERFESQRLPTKKGISRR